MRRRGSRQEGAGSGRLSAVFRWCSRCACQAGAAGAALHSSRAAPSCLPAPWDAGYILLPHKALTSTPTMSQRMLPMQWRYASLLLVAL